MRIFSLSAALAIALVAGADVRGDEKSPAPKANTYAKQDPKVLAVAENLKAELEKRLFGKSSHAWSCSCGKCGAGPSKVIGVSMPTTYNDQLALFNLWTCNMQDDTGKQWSQGITSYISWSELFALFRTTFQAYDVPIDHPYARYLMADDKFVPSGKLVSVRENAAVYIRPIGDVTKSPWAAARLRYYTQVPGHPAGDAFISCEVNPLHRRYGRSSRIEYHTPEPTNTSGFSLSIPGGRQDVEIPLARLLSVSNGTALFELNKDVEAFTPAKVPVGVEGEVKALQVPLPEKQGTYLNMERIQAAVTVTDLSTNKVVATVRTNEYGNFRIVLPPGSYELNCKADDINNAPDKPKRRYRTAPMKITVPADGWVETTIYHLWSGK